MNRSQSATGMGLLVLLLASFVYAQSPPGSVIGSGRPIPRPAEVPQPVEVAVPIPAAPYFWKKVITTQKTVEGCMVSARSNGLTKVRVTDAEVAGTSLDGSVYVAITCVGRANERAVAVVLGIGQNPTFVRQVVELSADQVRTAGIAD